MKQYQQIAASLRQQIIGGQFTVGTLLPSENELCAAFQTTRMTVRQALNELVREGFIERRHGKGSIVKADRQALGLLSFRGFSEIVSDSNYAARTDFLEEPAHTDWPEPFFYPLTPAERQMGCLTLHRLRFADNNPVMLELTYVPADGLEGLLTAGLVEGSLFRTLSIRYQINILGMEQSLRAVTATRAQTDIFRCAPHAPLIYVERRYQTNKPDFYLYSQLFCHTEHYAISSGV